MRETRETLRKLLVLLLLLVCLHRKGLVLMSCSLWDVDGHESVGSNLQYGESFIADIIVAVWQSSSDFVKQHRIDQSTNAQRKICVLLICLLINELYRKKQ